MAILYFQVPDTQDFGFGNEHLKLIGDISAYPALCALLGLSVAATPDKAYAALSAFQRAHGLIADGMAGPYNFALLNHVKQRSASAASRNASTSWLERVPPERLAKIFPLTLRKNLQIYAPYVFAALDTAGYTPNTAKGKVMCKVALAIIRAESEGFEPISENRSTYNTAPGCMSFGVYDLPNQKAKPLGNTQAGDGAAFKGRGFVQLTGRGHYAALGAQIHLPLEALPHLANLPEAAAALLVLSLQNHQAEILAAMQKGELAKARRRVNGGSHGLDRFKNACKQFDAVLTGPAAAGGKKTAGGFSFASFVNKKERFSLPVKRDRVDLRDLPYRPPLGSLPAEFPARNIASTYWKSYRDLVLDQGAEGACTGFGLACVINYLRFCRGIADRQTSASREKFFATPLAKVSPRMLYELARRYDEFGGANYEGSSCRGALKGWHKHGVCSDRGWPYDALIPANPDWTREALDVTLGVYYRIDRKNIVDMQAAIFDVGAVYVSAEVHAGWDPAKLMVKKGVAPSHQTLPLIKFQRGKTKTDGAHAFALVGYNRDGFVVQNSWGADWGCGGFAILSYEDWLQTGMDAWAATLGVPGVVNNAAA
ncbi:MAG TPA: C1 family peptidase, partial [Burkholderiales bacterium]|nr:C1 family peptidase [Burkholderiales bacterium]